MSDYYRSSGPACNRAHLPGEGSERVAGRSIPSPGSTPDMNGEPAIEASGEMSDWYKRFPSRYTAATMAMTLAEDGAYNRIIEWYMIHRRPPHADDKFLAAVCRVSIEEWMAVAPAVHRHLSVRKSMAHIELCDAILDAQDKTSDRKSELARLGAYKRWGKRQNRKPNKNNNLDATGIASASDTHAEGMRNDARGEEEIEEIEEKRKEDPPLVPPMGEPKSNPKRAKPRSQIDPQSQPDERDIAFATDHAVDPATDWPKFTNHHLAKATLSADWHASWRTWCLNSHKFAGNGNAKPDHHRNGFAQLIAESSLHDTIGTD